MNILFLSLLDFESIEEHNIYTDLLRAFRDRKHELFVVSPVERRKKKETFLIEENSCQILKLKIGNIQKTNYFEKGISLLRLQHQYIHGIKHYFDNVRFDLVLYATPPITFYGVVKYFKEKDQAMTYLLLKDIWPQGMVDLGVISSKSLLYHYFRKKELDIYAISDYVGCMSENNVKYLLQHDLDLNKEKIEVCPNAIEPSRVVKLTEEEKNSIKTTYNIPQNKVIFLYGGNLGRPQGIDFLLQIIKKCDDEDFFFLIVGDGTEYPKIKKFIEGSVKNNVQLIRFLPKEQYEEIVSVSDVGLIFLSPKFTVPNIPSRILSYMDASLPMLAATDNSTDLKTIFADEEIGLWCVNGNDREFMRCMKSLKDDALREKMGRNAREYLENNYTTRRCYDTIIKHFQK